MFRGPQCGVVAAILAAASVLALEPRFSVAIAQARYQENPTIRKSKARDALTKARMLNAQVEMMLLKNSDQVGKMVEMLSQSYGYQVTAIAQAEGIVREAKFKDPTLASGILDMYEHGKPATMMAQTQIKTGDYGAALGSLAGAKQSHQRFMMLLY
jgi:hypothetical protein